MTLLTTIRRRFFITKNEEAAAKCFYRSAGGLAFEREIPPDEVPVLAPSLAPVFSFFKFMSATYL
jgi:hypothetical protein